MNSILNNYYITFLPIVMNFFIRKGLKLVDFISDNKGGPDLIAYRPWTNTLRNNHL